MIVARFMFFVCLTQLSRRPLFFRETNPQPRKHTLWQASSDFTGGQASVYRYFIFIKLTIFYYYLTQTYDCVFIFYISFRADHISFFLHHYLL